MEISIITTAFLLMAIIDDLVKSPKAPFSVIPAPIFIGINSSRNPVNSSSSVRLRRTAFSGMTPLKITLFGMVFKQLTCYILLL